jgi:hypothetical protein
MQERHWELRIVPWATEVGIGDEEEGVGRGGEMQNLRGKIRMR